MVHPENPSSWRERRWRGSGSAATGRCPATTRTWARTAAATTCAATRGLVDSGTCLHRRRMKTEEKANVVAAVWGTELIQLLAALDILKYMYSKG